MRPSRRRQLEHVAPALVRRPASSWRPARRTSLWPVPARLTHYPAHKFDAIRSAGKVTRERGTHLALRWEAHEITYPRLVAEEGPGLQNGERTVLDNDRRWVDEALEIAHLNALTTTAGSKADPIFTATNGEGSKCRIADRRVHSKTCNGE